MKSRLISAAKLGIGLFMLSMPMEVAYGNDNPASNSNLYPPARYLQPLSPSPGQTSFDFNLTGSILGIPMIKARFKGDYSDTQYSVYTDLNTSGLGALLKKKRVWATTDGTIDPSGLNPVEHVHQNLDKKSRRVEMHYDYASRLVDMSTNPPRGSEGIPPASPKERFEADDVVSALLRILLSGHEVRGELCRESVGVFDGKQHYNLRMERIGTDDIKFEGKTYNAVVCNVYYEPISGFDPEDLPDDEESGTPVIAHFIDHPDLNMNVPIQVSYKISGFNAKVKLNSVDYKTAVM